MTDAPLWRIRLAGPDDAETLALIGAATFLETFAGLIDGAGIVAHCLHKNSADSYRSYLANGAKAWLVEIEPGNAPVGYALTCPPELELARPGDLELKRIYLLSRFRGHSIAGALLHHAVTEAGDAERLLLGVKADNMRAIAFYEKNGFEKIGTRRFDVGGKTYDDFVLARPLRRAQTL